MNKVVVSFVALLAAASIVQPTLAQPAANLTTSRIVIAPAQSPLARTIKEGLSTAYASARAGTPAYEEAQRLYFLYGERSFEPIWLSQDTSGQLTFSPAAEKIVALFRNAEAEGLRPQDYLTAEIDLTRVGGDAVAMATLETAFTSATTRYAHHLHNGRINPQSISTNLDIKTKSIDEAALLERLARSADPAAVLNELSPTHPEFLSLKAALASFNTIATDRPTPIAGGPTLRPGNTDPRVHAIRERLQVASLGSDIYDDITFQAVKSFQASQGLEVDGVIGPATISALNGGAEIRREDIIANMERWRWMPSDLGDFNVFVNIPEFRLSVQRNFQEEYTTRVVVGTFKNQTPVFSDSIRHLVVNPYWNVPTSIIKGEIAPAVLNNHGYTDAKNMDLIYNGDVVSPWQVNWSAVSASNFPFRVRQRPGPGNSLGQIKFLFPNKHDVYLHDTPSKNLFSRASRAFSHGCVRVEDPFAFADALMANEPNISRTSLEAMFGPSERWVNPTKQIPVHLAYFTVRVDGTGAMQNFSDVYGHHAALIAAMGLGATPVTPNVVADTSIPGEVAP
ncbi:MULTISPECIES: L,D-transpeptidase family protein [unclassified Devosia]|uniref:L,D-transpeptidase family protein n=1 Tax=unclassified Devosia TaxID=196773 RepID=UPI00145D5BE4|nr:MULTISPECIES: L,D-transpeptidase family protein [unclassified Devosia]MBJ6988699.1 L,D-transpeptidase family protein [Devosia sp. MC521]QMW62193.1 L,D-transpeptidase family protein [Devosia sp. MC521]